MDVYFLMRYLSNFRIKERGPIGCRNTKKSLNTIFHGGSLHSECYVFFVKKWFNISPEIEIINDYSVQEINLEEFDFFKL